MDNFCYMTFKSVHHAMRTDAKLKEKNFKYKIIPVPTSISATCGMCIRFEKEYLEDIKSVMEEDCLEYEGIHYLS